MGNTTRLNCMELMNVKEGTTVLILDMNQTHTDGRIFQPIREEYMRKINRINAMKDGLGLGLLQPIHTPHGEEESFVHLVNSAIKVLSSTQSMGVRQISAL